MPKDILKGCKCLESEDKSQIISALTIAKDKQQEEINEISARAFMPSLIAPYQMAIERIQKLKNKVNNTPEC